MAKKKKIKERPIYVIPKCKTAYDVCILSFDPGTANMGVAAVATHKNRIRVLANSVLTHPINDLIDLGRARTSFQHEVQRWHKRFNVRGMMAERFQTRGGSSMGKTIECVSTMLGILSASYPDTPFRLVIASQWKNAVQKRFEFDLKEFYKEWAVAPHQIDACLIGCYGLEMGLQQQFKWDPWTIAADAEATSLLELKRKRK